MTREGPGSMTMTVSAATDSAIIADNIAAETCLADPDSDQQCALVNLRASGAPPDRGSTARVTVRFRARAHVASEEVARRTNVPRRRLDCEQITTVAE